MASMSDDHPVRNSISSMAMPVLSSKRSISSSLAPRSSSVRMNDAPLSLADKDQCVVVPHLSRYRHRYCTPDLDMPNVLDRPGFHIPPDHLICFGRLEEFLPNYCVAKLLEDLQAD